MRPVAHQAEWTAPFSRGRLWVVATVSGFAIATLGGLMGLGGAEFRLPVLLGLFALAPRRAVPLNLLVSLVTVAAALASRIIQGALAPAWDLRAAILALACGGVVGARIGVRLAGRMSEATLIRVIASLLLAIAGLLGAEAAFGEATVGALSSSGLLGTVLGLTLGAGIGLVSSLLGVAGGELLIPTLIFVFGADIKTAGTASLLVSLPTVLVGVMRYRRQRAYVVPEALWHVGLPMAIGSIVGATLGTRLVGLVSVAVLKALLAVILAVSGVRMWRSHHQTS